MCIELTKLACGLWSLFVNDKVVGFLPENLYFPAATVIEKDQVECRWIMKRSQPEANFPLTLIPVSPGLCFGTKVVSLEMNQQSSLAINIRR